MGNNENGYYGHNIATALSLGESFGQAILSHVNVPLIWPWSDSREFHFATAVILGDPTLKINFNDVCPVTTTLEHDSSRETTLKHLHDFRDQVLAASPEGEHYTDLYYEHSPEVTSLLLWYPRLRRKSLALIHQFLPVVQSLLAGEEVKITQKDLQEIDAFLSAVAAHASPELQATIQDVQAELMEGAVLEQSGIMVRSNTLPLSGTTVKKGRGTHSSGGPVGSGRVE